MTAPLTPEALEEALADRIDSHFDRFPSGFWTGAYIAGNLMRNILAPLLAAHQQVTAERDEDRAEHARYRASAEEMWETAKRHGGRMLAEKRRADVAEAALAAATSELARLRAALTEIRDHPENHDDGPRSYAVKWAFWNIQNIARTALARAATAEPSKPAADAPWPSGCIKPNACSRHRTCVYAMSAEKCRHFGQDLGPAIEAAEAARAATAREGA